MGLILPTTGVNADGVLPNTSFSQNVALIFGGSGIVPAALVAIILNILLPKEEA